MKVIRDSIFQIIHQLMTKPLIPLCKNSNKKYYLNILIIIVIIYPIYIESELYKGLHV